MNAPPTSKAIKRVSFARQKAFRSVVEGHLSLRRPLPPSFFARLIGLHSLLAHDEGEVHLAATPFPYVVTGLDTFEFAALDFLPSSVCDGTEDITWTRMSAKS